MKLGKRRPRKKGAVCKQFDRSAYGAVDCDGMMDCAFANENASAWATRLFLLQALLAERAEYRHPSRDPWPVWESQRVVGEEKTEGFAPRS